MSRVNLRRSDLAGAWTATPGDDSSDPAAEAKIDARVGPRPVKTVYDVASPAFGSKQGTLPVTASTEIQTYRTSQDLLTDEKSSLSTKAVACGTKILYSQLGGTSNSPGVTIHDVRVINFPGRNQGPSTEAGSIRAIVTFINNKKVPVKFVTDDVFLVRGLSAIDIDFTYFEAAPLSSTFEADVIQKINGRLAQL